MPDFEFNNLPSKSLDPESTDSQNIAEQIENLKRSHSQRHQLMNQEIWAIVGTMDDFIPGFWSRFMVNRQIALKEFLDQKKAKQS